MYNVAQPPGNQHFWIPEQTVVPPRVNAAPLYLPNLIAALIESVGIVVGSIGPWMVFLAFTRNAMDGDGTITLILGIIAGAALFAVFNLGRTRVNAGWMIGLTSLACLAGLVSLITAVADIYEVTSRKAELFGNTIGAQVGWGLWMVAIASFVLIATTIVVATQVPKIRRP
jgi:hypothetical protein